MIQRLPVHSNFFKLSPHIQRVYAPFLKQMLAAHGENIISIFIYGSAAGKNFIPRRSDINSAVVLKTISLETLQKSLKSIAAARRSRIAAPLMLTQEHINSSLDAFPIEFFDMKEKSVVVYGQDALKDIEIPTEHMRLLCEQQIKGKLIRIRQAYLEVGLRRIGVELLLRESLSSLIPVFKSLLCLKAQAVPEDKTDILAKTGELFGVDMHVMIAIWQEKKNDERVAGRDVREAFDDYIRTLERLAQAVDRL